MASVIDINIIAKDLASGVIKDVKSSIQNIGTGISGGFNAIIGFAKKTVAAIAGISAAVGTAVAGIASYGVTLAGSAEQTRVAFTTMLGDAEKAGELMQDLSDFAKTTPFEFPEISSAGKSLLAFGFTANEIKDTLRKVGDVASGVDVPFNELAVIYGKIKTQNTVYTEDILQLAERGIPVIRELAKQFGVTEDEVKKLASESKIKFSDIEMMFNNLTGEGGQFFGMMENQSQTFNGLISTMSDNFKAFAMSLIGVEVTGEIKEGGLFFYLKEALIGWMADTDEANSKLNGLAKIVNTLKLSLMKLVPVFINIGKTIGDKFLKFIIPLAQNLFDNFQNIFGFVKSNESTFQSVFQTIGNVAGTVFNNISKIITNVVIPVLTQLSQWIVRIYQMFLDNWPKIQPVIEKVQIIATGVVNVLVGLFQFLWPIIKFVVDKIIDILGFLLPILLSVASWFLDMVISIGEYLGDLWSFVSAVFTNISNFFTNTIPHWWNILVLGVTLIVNSMRAQFMPIWDFVQWVFNSIGNFLGGVMNWWDSTIMSGINIIVNNIKGAFSSVRNFVVSTFEGIVNSIKNAFNTITNVGGGIWDAIKKVINDKIIGNFNRFSIQIPIPGVNAKIELPDLPYLSTGTTRVKKSGLAVIHEDEAVLPADVNPWNPRNTGSVQGQGITIEKIENNYYYPTSENTSFSRMAFNIRNLSLR